MAFANYKMKGSSSKAGPTIDDAKIYIQEIKDAFKDDKDKFNEFSKTMKDIKNGRGDLVCMLARVKELFEGHRELLLKFNAYLPNEFAITPPPRKPKVNLEYARKYLIKVKTRFQDDQDVYKSFLAIMNMYRKKEKSGEEIQRMVISLFKDQPDLIDGFNEFLP
ncbi:paired amphipathic helix protein Sin3-like 4 [Vicia villosa]|uniref:paired amphipathic helix protein Sin3-like 4 n=1 Tax=Vicia villosa TaxID=3911 RepID=UPI00273CE11C|nr:paired amphipathic helix protein Sin3-like 4 [Vicia villosa]